MVHKCRMQTRVLFNLDSATLGSCFSNVKKKYVAGTYIETFYM